MPPIRPRLRFPLACNSARVPPATGPISVADSDRANQRLTLRDGRVLGFAEYGSPSGTPLLYFHGYPSSRLEGWALDNTAHRLGLRIVSPDRPGFGISTHAAERRITDWPRDVEALTQHLGLSRFAILGCSGGGPYAVACAHSLPHETMKAVGVLAGGGPWVAGTHDIGLTRRLAAVAAARFPGGLEKALDGAVASLRWALYTDRGQRAVENWMESIEKSEEGQGLSIQERRENVVRIQFEAFSQGSAAAAQEARLLSQDWGFPFEQVTYDKVVFWHGTRDVNTPIRLTRYMVERMPHAELREFDEDHYTMGRHLEKIVSEFASEIREQEEKAK